MHSDSFVKAKSIISVGIDIGTSTTHLVFSKMLLKEDPLSKTRKFIISDREILYKSPIFFTPLIDIQTIDTSKLSKLLEKEYEKSGININDIDTGAVIITGETARKENADAVLKLMSDNAGKFVAATAGPNLESVLSCHGAGVTDFTLKNGCSILHTDIGGGTSNIALAKHGNIVTTACINVGGRLLVFENDNRILTKIEPAALKIASDLNIKLELGKEISENNISLICEKLTDCLFEVLLSTSPYSTLTNTLLMTQRLFEEIKERPKFDALSFSGGVAEYIYYSDTLNKKYNDIGDRLALSIKKRIENSNFHLHSPKERIRATVIGAGQYSMEVSGSTTFISPTLLFPLKNIIVLSPYVERSKFSKEHIISEIQKAFIRIDIEEGNQIVAMFFKNPVGIVYDKIKEFVLALEKALPNTIKIQLPIILLFDSDIGKSVGNILKRETSITSDIISIDEIVVREGDFLDIGKPIIAGQVVPVIIKSLIFN
ncbi:MAG: ethanolamine ammonia-lyase reactivating factor EutA [Candidatus Thorarchaeota archaeon]